MTFPKLKSEWEKTPQASQVQERPAHMKKQPRVRTAAAAAVALVFLEGPSGDAPKESWLIGELTAMEK